MAQASWRDAVDTAYCIRSNDTPFLSTVTTSRNGAGRAKPHYGIFGDAFEGDKIGALTLNSSFQTILEGSFIDKVGTNPNFLLARSANAGNNNPSEYLGLGAKVGMSLSWKKFKLSASYRYLAEILSRVEDQSIFTAGAEIGLLNSGSSSTSFGIEYRRGDDENSFQSVDETKLNLKFKF